MKLIPVAHSLNQLYYVAATAIEQATEKSITNLKKYEIKELKVEVKKEKEVYIFLKLKAFNKGKYEKAFKEVQQAVQLYVSNLLDKKPKNIEIQVKF